MKGWKQPIPNCYELEKVFREDYGCSLLYRELVWRACNQDDTFTGRRGKTVAIKRGQVVFGRTQYEKYLQHDGATIHRWLEKLSKVYMLVSKQADNNFTIVSINNYDEVVGMSMQVSNQRATNEQPMSTSKSVKSDRVKEITPPTPSKLYKSERSGKEYTLEQVGQHVLEVFAQQELRTHKTTDPFIKHLEHWLTIYSLNEIDDAMSCMSGKGWWCKDPDPTMLFRLKGRDQHPVDYIGELLHIYRKYDSKRNA